uniref:Uncharacterized protein n=1 Tax=Ciona intestinalis TaxID=7719 RepID=F6Q9Q7_CIOIN
LELFINLFLEHRVLFHHFFPGCILLHKIVNNLRNFFNSRPDLYQAVTLSQSCSMRFYLHCIKVNGDTKGNSYFISTCITLAD